MKRALVLLGVLCLTASLIADTNALFIAKSALRDGLWGLARRAAKDVGGQQGAELTIESYAREGAWDDLIINLPLDLKSEWAIYYRALALFMKGENEATIQLLSETKFTSPHYKRLSSILYARILFAKGEAQLARAKLSEEGIAPDDDQMRLFFADIHEAIGEKAVAQSFWRQILASTNSTDIGLATAAVKLKDIQVCENVIGRIKSSPAKAAVLLALSKALLERGAEGDLQSAKVAAKKSISRHPDAPGAKEMMVMIAEKEFHSSDAAGALKTYDEALVVWPDLSRDYTAHSGRGWALLSLGRAQEADEEFQKAFNCTTNNNLKSQSLLKRAESLIVIGKRRDAEVIYETIVKDFPETSAAQEVQVAVKIKRLLESGDKFFKEFRFEEAEKMYLEVASVDATLATSMKYRRALCFYARGLDAEAEKLMRELAAAEKPSPLAIMWLGKYLYNRRNLDEAAKFFTMYASIPNVNNPEEALLWASRSSFGRGDYETSVKLITKIVSQEPAPSFLSTAYLLQADALFELARFAEAILVLERVISYDKSTPEEKTKAELKKADALFAMGADNPERYRSALEAYGALKKAEAADPSMKLVVSYKIARTLDKLGRHEEAIERYYTEVLLEYRRNRADGLKMTGEAQAVFSRAAFRLADEYESRGKNYQAVHILELVSGSDVPASSEAKKRIEYINAKGVF